MFIPAVVFWTIIGASILFPIIFAITFNFFPNKITGIMNLLIATSSLFLLFALLGLDDFIFPPLGFDGLECCYGINYAFITPTLSMILLLIYYFRKKK